jgi:hypothetical protein
MSLLDNVKKLNPLRRRQPGTGQAQTGVRTTRHKFTVKEANAIANDVQMMLRNNPDLTDEEMASALNVSIDPSQPSGNNYLAAINTGRAAYEKEVLLTPPVQRESTTGVQSVDGNQINLVMYSPERIVAQVAQEVSTISFGTSASQQYKHAVGDTWANIAPWVLCAGTVLEVFLFVWSHTNQQTWKLLGIPSWVVMAIVLAGIVSMEATFATVSLKTAAIREDGRLRVDGPTATDKAMVRRHMYVWIPLAIGVSLGQIAFLVGDSTGITPIFIAYAVIRVTGTMWGDAYTAFFHVEGPTNEAKALAADQRRAKYIEQKLQQKNVEMNIVNEQVQHVMRTQNKGEIELNHLKTELTISKQEDQVRVEAMQAQADSARLMGRMSANFLRAFFDEEMDQVHRDRVFRTMVSMMDVNKQLPAPKELDGDD